MEQRAAMRRTDQDESILEACRRGDREALRLLVERYQDRVHAIALHFSGGDRAAASDVAQQVFVKLFTKLRDFRGDSELATWLYRLVANACLDERRRRKRHVALEVVEGPDAAESPSPYDDLARRESGARVRRALARLSPKLRIAVLLKHFEDLSYQEMASALGCSLGTVASRLNRGHQELARQLRAPAEN